LWSGALIQSAVSPWRICLAALILIPFGIKKTRFLVLIVAILVGATAMSIRQASLEHSAITGHFNSEVRFTAQVMTDPSQTSSGKYSFTARLLNFEIDQKSWPLRVPIRIICESKIDYLPGQTVKASARVVKTHESRVAALFIVNKQFEVITPPSHWAGALGAIRAGLRSHSGESDAGALIPGMVLGDTSKQSAQFKEQMKRSGLTHLVAVSGANFAIVSSFVLWCMQFLIRRKKFRIIATAIALTCFIALVRPSPSVLRAAAMAAVLLSAQATKRKTDALPALGFAIAAVVIGDPWQSRDAGFALSVLATAGLLLFAPFIEARLPTHKMLASALAPPIAAIVFCSPILVALSGYLSPISIIANLLAAPLVAPITILGFIAALVSPFAPLITTTLIVIITIPAELIAKIAQWSSEFPVLTIHNGSIGFVIVAALVGILWLFKNNWRRITVLLLAVILALTWLQRWPAGDWQIANCDVGQGDSMVINLHHGQGVVIDVGPDPVAEDRCLRHLGITNVPLLVLSHFHADHVGGLSGLLKSRSIGQVWVSNNLEPILESSQALSLLQRSKVVTVQKGFMFQMAGINFEILWPENTVNNFDSLPGDGSQINNSSIAMLVTNRDWSMFTAGDIEPPVQHRILGFVHRVDIYKVCHHGSKYQDEQLMTALSAQVGVISVGSKNSYGHPSPETIASLTRLGTQVLRTDTDGAVAITARDHHLRVRKSRGTIRLFYWS
jgi:competence protein ComEC